VSGSTPSESPAFLRNIQRLSLIVIFGLLVACGGSDNSDDSDNVIDTTGTDGTGETGGAGDTGGIGDTDGTGGAGDNGGGSLALELSTPAPSNYVWGTLAFGSNVYVDRTYTYTTVPSAYLGLQYLQTANDDKTSTGSGFLSFAINKTADVYVGHVNIETNRPAWLDSWAWTGDTLVTTDRTLYLYKQTFIAGTVTLSGNESGASMYVILTKDADGTARHKPTSPPASAVPQRVASPREPATPSHLRRAMPITTPWYLASAANQHGQYSNRYRPIKWRSNNWG